MKKTLYYVVEKETQDFDGVEECTGNKTITTYSVINGGLEKQFDIECLNEDNSEEAIKEYLDDNGMSEDDFNLVIL